jgi:DNA polymerase (family 10)
LVHDLDLVCVPVNQGSFIGALQSLGHIKIGGQKLLRCQLPETSLDIYIATRESWATILLIRTGSKEHNIMMCSLAKQKGMKLHADGTGLFRVTFIGGESKEERIAGDTEESIFQALGMAYKEPERREWPAARR